MRRRSGTGNSRAVDVVSDPTAADLNTRGEGVGGGVDGPEHHPWVYRGGLVHRLAGQGRVNAIGEDGTIIGYVGTDPYVWHPDGTSGRLPSPKDVPPNERVSALKISGSWVVGSAAGLGMARWNLDTGAVETVPGLRNDGPGYGHGNEAINAAGVVVVKNGYNAVLAGGGRTVTLPSLGPNYMNYPSPSARMPGSSVA